MQVRNPYAEQLQLPADVFKPRRTNAHYLAFIEAVTFYHQYQRTERVDEDTGERYIEISSMKVEKNGTGILDTMIYKKDFNRFLDENLRQYGVLLYPVLKASNDIIQINYSISIPLTDVGTGVTAKISKEGVLSFSPQLGS